MKLDRTQALAVALGRAGFRDTAEAIAGGEAVRVGAVRRMLRWAVGYYVEERPVMARALRCAKAWAREVGHA